MNHLEGHLRASGWIPVLAIVAAFSFGCASRYRTPSAPADFASLGLSPQAGQLTEEEREQLTDREIRRRLAIKPLASFPANLAYGRLQSAYTRWYGNRQEWRAQLVVAEDKQSAEAWAELDDLPGITSIAQLNTLLVSEDVQSEQDLRAGAASLHADLILLYTYDSRIETDEQIPYAGLFTIGLFPDRTAKASVTASAIIVDVRSGFVYGAASGTGSRDQLASAWTSEAAVDDAVRAAEREATTQLVASIRSLWASILETHAPQIAASTGDSSTHPR